MTDFPGRLPTLFHHLRALNPSCGAYDPELWLRVAAAVQTSFSVSRLRALILSAVPRLVNADFKLVPFAKPQVRFLVTTADLETLLLSLSPRPSTLVFRSERLLILAETALLHWLSSSPVVYEINSPRPNGPEVFQSNIKGNPASRCALSRHSTQLLQEFLPRLVGHGSAKAAGHGEFILTKPVQGTTVTTLATPLSLTERKCVYFQVGQLLRRISSHHSPNGKFGTALAVLASEPTVPNIPWKRTAALHLHSRHDRWSDAFLSILESTLRDAEDFNVAIYSEAVRSHVNCFRCYLDAVTLPRSVGIDAGEDRDMLVSLLGGSRNREYGPSSTVIDHTTQRETKSSPSDKSSGTTDVSQAEDYKESIMPLDWASVRVTGIQTWGNCVFGDPLFASVLSQNAIPEIWQGFETPLQDRGSGLPDLRFQPLDNMGNVRICRLYECHHAVTAIVKEYGCRCNDSEDREMPARKRLTQALRILDSLDDFGRERRPHPLEEVSGKAAQIRRWRIISGRCRSSMVLETTQS